jgi:hypothetical protein
MGYKYTYEDWVNGNVQAEYLHKIKDDISPEDYSKIEQLTREAFIKKINDSIKAFRRVFFVHLNMSLVKDDVLSEWIYRIEARIKDFKDHKSFAVFAALSGGDGRNRFLTASEIDEYLSFDVDKAHFNVVFALYNKIEKGSEALDYIILVNFLKWLNWFKQKQLDTATEPFVQPILNSEEESAAIAKISKVYSWQGLFKDIEQADKVLALLSEFLTDTGQWKTSNVGRHLMALCSELKQKGYLKQNLSSSIVANAFNIQFGTKLTPKNFQPGELLKAEDYRDNFRHIPTRK